VKSIDVVFLVIPKLKTDSPILGPAQLKSCLAQSGWSSFIADFNQYLYLQTKKTNLAYIWSALDRTLVDSDLIKNIEQQFVEIFSYYYKTYIASKKPKVLAISVFSLWSSPSLRLICNYIRKNYPKQKILLGGPALGVFTDYAKQWILDFKKENLFDDFISGEADIAINKYMMGYKDYPGINNFDFQQNPIQDTLPYPNYDDIDFNDYDSDENRLYVNGSKGCVRKCAYCNIPIIWNKYVAKTGKRLADEVIFLHKKYNSRSIKFTDSLVNGNQKEFRIFIKNLSEYNKTTTNKIKWGGYYIIREPKYITEDYFDDLKESGCSWLNIGIESGSEKVRYKLKKPFTNKAIEYHLQQFDRVGIQSCDMLMIVGFPTEAEEDYQESLDILDMFAKYTCVEQVGCDHPMIVIPDTPVHNDMYHYEVNNYVNGWEWDGSDHDFKIRIERFYKFINKAIDLGLYKYFSAGNSSTLANQYKDMNPDPEILKIIEKIHGTVK
jgi:radical SAM superfamily enzyme YgiQ (UPF0313 family)